MAVPSSGAISLLGIAKELKITPDGYTSTIPTSTFLQYQADDISLRDMSTASGDFTGDTINLANSSANRPDGLTPHSMSEFYSYDHDYVIASGHYLVWSRTAGSAYSVNRLWTDPSNTTYNTDPIVNPLGTATTSKWRKASFDLSPYRNALVRLKIGFFHGTTSFRCDVGLTSFYIETTSDDMLDGYNRYSFSGDYAADNPRDVVGQSDLYVAAGDVMQRQSGTSSVSYSSTTGWSDFNHTGTNLTALELNQAVDGAWNWYQNGPTGSSNTGPDNVYVAYQNVFNGQVQSQYYDWQDLGGLSGIYLNYLLYEASNQSTADWAWMRTVAFYVPNDAETFHFIYSAWSNDQTNWYNSELKIYIEVD